MVKRIVRPILPILIIFSLIFSIANADTIQPRADTHFQGYGVTFGTTESGNLRVTITVTAVETSAILGVPTFDIQQKISGIWTTVSDGNTGVQKTDTVTCTFSRIFGGVVEGEKYRVIATMYCKKYDGSARSLEFTSQSYTLGA